MRINLNVPCIDMCLFPCARTVMNHEPWSCLFFFFLILYNKFPPTSKILSFPSDLLYLLVWKPHGHWLRKKQIKRRKKRAARRGGWGGMVFTWWIYNRQQKIKRVSIGNWYTQKIYKKKLVDGKWSLAPMLKRLRVMSCMNAFVHSYVSLFFFFISFLLKDDFIPLTRAQRW